MANYIEKVKEFHETFNHSVNENIGDESLEIRKLRIQLLFEELRELAEAGGVYSYFADICSNEYVNDTAFLNTITETVDHEKELDALCDLQYVLSGKILTGGYHKVFDAAFSAVHHSNMSKSCENETVAKATVDHYTKLGESCSYEKIEDRYIVKRDDGKILKSVNYNKVNLKNFVIEDE